MSARGVVFLTALLLLGGAGADAALVDAFDVVGTATFDANSGLWLYEYTVTGQNARRGLSHWWLELPPFKAASILRPNNPDAGEIEFPQFGEPTDADLVTAQGVDLSEEGNQTLDGIKWGTDGDLDGDESQAGFSFYSSHGPSAPDAYTWFAKFSRDYDYGRTIGPNGQHVIIPEPGTVWLLGTGLLGAVRSVRGRRLRLGRG